jgi:hypothetical protein
MSDRVPARLVSVEAQLPQSHSAGGLSFVGVSDGSAAWHPQAGSDRGGTPSQAAVTKKERS